ncbi:MAG TPA: hypothetical protein VGM88_20000 [Kofleriaceae bacterium]
MTQDLRAPSYPPAIDPDARASRDLLVALLLQRHWVIVTIMPLPQRPAHAIVLVGMTDADAFVYLDPADPRDSQPRAFAEDDFISHWTGELAVFPVD